MCERMSWKRGISTIKGIESIFILIFFVYSPALFEFLFELLNNDVMPVKLPINIYKLVYAAIFISGFLIIDHHLTRFVNNKFNE